MRARVMLVLPALLMLAHLPGEARQKQFGAPAAAIIQINVIRYTPDADRTAVEGALKTGGYPAFLTALRGAPVVGAVTFADQKWPIRWARERSSGAYSRNIVVVTDQPIFFVGGGSAKAKPRE